MKTLILAAFLLLAPGGVDTLSQTERDRAVAELEASQKALQEAVKGFSDAQWNFKPSPDHWSAAECVEHLTLSEYMVYGVVRQEMMKGPAEPEKRDSVKGKDEMVVKMVPDRSHKVKTISNLEPTHKFGTPEKTLEYFIGINGMAIDYVKTTDDDLRDHFRDHPALGRLDGYQWILFIAEHTRRHTAQILELVADPNFPKK
jgi:DinB superfamily